MIQAFRKVVDLHDICCVGGEGRDCKEEGERRTGGEERKREDVLRKTSSWDLKP